jgi:integrase
MQCAHPTCRSIVGCRSASKAWTNACQAARRPGLLFHDLRRSAVRNLCSAGVDQSVAMKISGHRTIATFLRYRIGNDEDVKLALAKTEAAIAGAAANNVIPLREATD